MILIDVIKQYVEANASNLHAPIEYEQLALASNSLAIQQAPGIADEDRYMDGTRVGTVGIVFLAKGKKGRDCINSLTEIEQILDFPFGLQLSEECFIKSELTSKPVFIEKGDKKEFIYEISFDIEYNVKGA